MRVHSLRDYGGQPVGCVVRGDVVDVALRGGDVDVAGVGLDLVEAVGARTAIVQ